MSNRIAIVSLCALGAFIVAFGVGELTRPKPEFVKYTSIGPPTYPDGHRVCYVFGQDDRVIAGWRTLKDHCDFSDNRGDFQ